MAVGEGETFFDTGISVVRPMKVGHVDGPHQSCSGTASQTEDWQLRAFVNANTQSMRLLLGYTTSDERGTWGGRNCGEARELNVVVLSELEDVVMPTQSGARKEVSLTSMGRKKTREWLIVTVVDGAE